MSDTVFNSAFWFENKKYQEYEDDVYNSRKKQNREDFSTFLAANLTELEFKKIKKKRRSKPYYEYQFKNDKKQKIRVIEDLDGVHIIALYDNKENTDIEEEIVDGDKGQLFKLMMDRIMDALEVTECSMFDLETKTQTNLARTSNQIKQSKLKRKRKIQRDKKNDDESDYDEEEDEVVEEEEESDSEEEESESLDLLETNKRRSSRLSAKKSTKKNRKRKRKIKSKKKSDSDSDIMSESDGSEEFEVEPKRKKRKLNKSQFRKMKKEFVKNWKGKEYVEAVHCAEDYNMTSKEINDLIESINEEL